MTSSFDPRHCPGAGTERDAGTRIGIWRRLWHDRDGATAVIIAIGLPVLLAITGLGVDAGWWYTIHRQNQSAADAGALSAAYEVIAGASGNMNTAAAAAATQNGWVDPAKPPAGLTPISVTYPCCTKTFAAGGIEVVLQQQLKTWFSNFSSLADVTITNRAIALVDDLPPTCMWIKGSSSPPNGTQNLAQAVSVQGGGGVLDINAPGCSLVDNSDSSSAFYFQGNAKVTAATLITPGEITTKGSAYSLALTNRPQVGAASVPDPYAPPPGGTCGTAPDNTVCLTHSFLDADLSVAKPCTSSTTAGVTTYSGAVLPDGTTGCILASGKKLQLKGGTYDLSPGTYWVVDADLEVGPGGGNSTTLNGTGVTIIFTTAKTSGNATIGGLILDSNANLNIVAPSSGAFAGLALIADSNGLPAGITPTWDAWTVSSNPTESISGLVYAPDASVDFVGTPSASGPNCLLLFANQASLQGNASFATSGCGSLGLGHPKTVALIG